ncbi:antitoxin [Yinghuangia sp. ASG 101]|uniref:antitoxin n=1 Tax=Yinghuangia sp. ASG 101 TaxID=2896848 RepID=UPI001E357DE8|nr:antitoxin [Yinghuangia sp. ASG 101]UGQ12586.1 antitoxin [Yinghuangia sp. ASG 101]
MGLFDSVKKMKLGELKDKAAELAAKHDDKIDQGVDKAADFIDARTGHKHGDKLDSGAEKLKGAVDKLGDQAEPQPPKD